MGGGGRFSRNYDWIIMLCYETMLQDNSHYTHFLSNVTARYTNKVTTIALITAHNFSNDTTFKTHFEGLYR